MKQIDDTEFITCGGTVFGGNEIIHDTELTPEYLRPREFGKKEFMCGKTDNLIMVSQQRGDANPSFKDIKESIDQDDLINWPDVALLQYEDMKDYLDFINQVWGDDNSLDNFICDNDGYYHLVVAGHTRVLAMQMLDDERKKLAFEEGYPDAANATGTCWYKIHKDMNPTDILALQLKENLHNKPSEERAAIAMVELYYYGLRNGQWKNKTEFTNINKDNFSKENFNKALLFTDLDEKNRASVFNKSIKFGSAVELARSVKPHRQYLIKKYFGNVTEAYLTDDQNAKIDEDIRQWNEAEIISVQKKQLNITACRKRYKSLIESWSNYTLPEEDPQEALFMNDPDRAWRDHRRRVRDKLREGVNYIAGLPNSEAFRALQLHAEVLNPDSQEAAEILQLLDSGIKQFDKKLKKEISCLAINSTTSNT